MKIEVYQQALGSETHVFGDIYHFSMPFIKVAYIKRKKSFSL
jgi:hypothetical protein